MIRVCRKFNQLNEYLTNYYDMENFEKEWMKIPKYE